MSEYKIDSFQVGYGDIRISIQDYQTLNSISQVTNQLLSIEYKVRVIELVLMEIRFFSKMFCTDIDVLHNINRDTVL